MAVEMEQVKAALEPEEPDYPGAVKSLGTDALPHLERIITGDQTGLAAKAAYLAGLIGTDKCVPAMNKAAASGQAVVRMAAASAAKHLPEEYRDSLVLQLVDDVDVGVQKLAMKSAPAVAAMSDALRSRVEALGKSKTVAKAPADKQTAKTADKKVPAKKAAAKRKKQ